MRKSTRFPNKLTLKKSRLPEGMPGGETGGGGLVSGTSGAGGGAGTGTGTGGGGGCDGRGGCEGGESRGLIVVAPAIAEEDEIGMGVGAEETGVGGGRCDDGGGGGGGGGW